MREPKLLHSLSFRFNTALLLMLLLTAAGSVYLYASTTTHFQKLITLEFENSSRSLSNSLLLIEQQLVTAAKNSGIDHKLANALSHSNEKATHSRIKHLREFNNIELLLLLQNDKLFFDSSIRGLSLNGKTSKLILPQRQPGTEIHSYFLHLGPHLFFCCEKMVPIKNGKPLRLVTGLNITSKRLHSLATNSHIAISVVQDGAIAYSTDTTFVNAAIAISPTAATPPINELPEVVIQQKEYYAHPVYFPHQSKTMFLLSHSKNDITKINTSVLVKLAGFLFLQLLLLFLFGLFCTKNFLHPIRTFTEAINTVSAGKFDSHLTFKTNNELQILANHFNAMTDYIRERDANLEQLVKERTENLARQNTFIDTILSSANELGIIATDPTGNITYANPTAEKLFGYSAEAVIGHKLEAHHGDTQTPAATISHGMRQLPTSKRFFYTVTRQENGQKGGTQIECTITEMRSGENTLRGYLLLARDVTISKRINQRLQKTLAELDIIFENSSLAIVYEHHGTIARVNRAFETLFGFQREEVLGQAWQPFFETLHDGKTDSFWDESTEAYYVQNKENTAFWITVNKRSSEPDKSNGGVIWVFEDVSEQKEAELKIKQLSLAVEQSPNSVVITDTEGTIQYVNPAFSQITGYSYDEAIGQNPSILKSGTTPPALYKNMWETIQNGKEWSGQFINKTKAGDLYEEHVTIAPIRNEAGEITHFIATKENVTELKEARKQADLANKAKGEFLANMSHEIRTPINLIFGMTELLLDTTPTDEQRTFLKRIQVAGSNLLSLINDILDYSKIESGMLFFEPNPFELKKLFADLEESLSLAAEKKGLHFQCVVEEQITSYPIGDRLRLYQVLMNLASNAIKFTKKGKVEIKGIVTENDSSHYSVLFTVKDTGIGIRPETQKTIFNNFVQANSSITREYGGSGLGLAISSKLIDLMGGTIKLVSTPGLGSIFSFSLCFPKGTNASEQQQQPATGQLPTSPLHILVVEDNQANQDLAKLILQKDSHHVTLCSNGLDALKVLAENRFDVVLMDVQMPVMDGLTATTIIRQCEQGKASLLPEHPALHKTLQKVLYKQHLYIIAMTANAMSGDREKCLAAGTDEYLTKPYTATQLRSVLYQVPSEIDVVHDKRTISSVQKGAEIERGVVSLKVVTNYLQSNFSVGEENVQAIIKSFTQTITDTLHEISSALESEAYEAAISHSHTLKGSLHNLGLAYQAALAQRIEHSAHEHDIEKCFTLFQELEKELAPLLA